MGNCLMTKLKASVNNDNLPIFGEMIIDIADDNRVSAINIQADGALEYRLIGNGHFTDSTGAEDYGKSLTTSGIVYVIKSEPCSVKVLDTHYTMTSIYANQGPRIHADALVSRKNTLTSVDMMDNCGITGSISGEGIFKDITYFAVSNWESEAPMNINIFNGNTVTDTIFIAESDKMEGPIESLLESIWEAGKRSGTITLVFYGSPNVTFSEGNTFYNGTATFSNAGISVETGGGEVFTYDGSSWTYPS